MLDSFPFPLSNWPGIDCTDDGRPPGWTPHRRMSGRHRHVQITLMRKIIIFLVQIELAALAFWLLWRSLCGSKAVSAERDLRDLLFPLETTVHFRLLNTDKRYRNKGPDWKCSWFFLLCEERSQSSWVVQSGCAGDCPTGVGSCRVSSVPAVVTDCHTCAGDDATGSHSSCSHQFSPGFSDLVNWALAGSLWPPNASLLFCQKEVLMLLGWRFRVEICLDKWVEECSGCWPALLPSPWASCHTRALRCQRQSRLGRRGTLSSFHSPRWGAN